MKLMKQYWYYICIIIVFGLMFYSVPPFCDRWMESTVLLEIGGMLRYLCGQVYWVKQVNIRFLSNIFSYLVDRNILFRSICNGVMIAGISMSCVKISEVGKSKDKAMVGLFSAFLLMLVSWGIKAEVYFYASTLFLSAFLLVEAVFFLDLRQMGNDVKKGEKVLLYVLIVVGSLWVENNVPMIIAATGMIWLIRCWQNKKIGKEALVPFIVSFLCGLLVVCADKKISVGKMAIVGTNEEKWYSTEPLTELICDNSVLFLILSTLVILLICKYRRKISIRLHVTWLIHLVVWIMMLFCNLLLCGKNIYEYLKEEPEQRVSAAYGWVNVKNANVDEFLKSFLIRFDRVLLIFLLLAVGSLIFLFFAMGKELVGISLIFMGMAGTAIPVLGFDRGSRVTASAIFSAIVVIGILAGEMLRENERLIKKLWYGIFVAVCVFAVISADHVYTFLALQNHVAEQRWEIAKEIEMQQHMGKWDYDSFAVMPEYKMIGGRGFLQHARTSPENTEPYYPYFLHYYNLGEDTKIVFSDSDYQLIKWIDEKNCVRLVMNSLKNHQYEMYRFQISDVESSQDESMAALEDSGWTEENEWIIPNKYCERQDIIFKCYGRTKDGIVEEIEYKAIIWDESESEEN